jgi:PKD repeat protein
LIKEEDPANVLRLKVNGDNVTDEMVIHLNENATENFDGSYDAKKIFSNDPSNPSISSINNNKDLSINCLPINGTSMSIPIRVTVGSNGMYNLSWNGIEGFTEGSCFVIEDLDNGNKTTLEKNGLYYFNAAVGFKAPRFIIHISSPLPKTVVEASCSNSQDGSITITNPSGIECMVQLKDANGNLIKEASINNTFTFDKLATGAYQLSYPNATLCGSMNQMLNISATNVVNSQFDASAKEIETNAVVTFKTNLSKSNNITWDFGDGTTATEVTTVNHQYKEVGTYNVTMTNQKGECSAAETMALNVVNVAGTANSMDIKQQNGVYYAVFNFTENTAVSIRLTNTAGQEVAALQQFEGKSGKVKISLDQFANGIYMIILNNGKESITKKIVK